jgi:hypothetical protein
MFGSPSRSLLSLPRDALNQAASLIEADQTAIVWATPRRANQGLTSRKIRRRVCLLGSPPVGAAPGRLRLEPRVPDRSSAIALRRTYRANRALRRHSGEQYCAGVRTASPCWITSRGMKLPHRSQMQFTLGR